MPTVLLVCRKRDPDAPQAWWDDICPELAFTEARKAIAAYRFHKLAQTDTAGFDPLTQWYFLAWDAFRAREFPYDEA